ncbi:MAG TPA: hypothetical protein PKH58_01425 [Paludibacteraceae bacterium]|nr:hypothetical protein [Paludibacteraceae bacterium]
MALVTIIPSLSFSRNFPVLVVNAEEVTTVVLKQGTETVLSESYYPDDSGHFEIDLADLLTSLLTVDIPQLPGEQAGALAAFTITLTETGLTAEEFSFTLIKGGVLNGVEDMDAFCAGNMLTWHPQIKRVKLSDSEFITYYAVEPALVKAKAWFLSNPVITVGAVLDAGHLHVINATFSVLRAMFPAYYYPRWIDIWIENQSGAATWVQRYELIDEYDQFDDLFLFENSLGGLDTIRFTGQLTEQEKHDQESAKFGLETRDYYLDFNRVMSKNTGLFQSQAESDWAREFFASTNRWWWKDGVWKKITVSEYTVERVYNDMRSYKFEFSLSQQEPLRNLAREVIPDPEDPYAFDFNDDFNHDYLIQQ